MPRNPAPRGNASPSGSSPMREIPTSPHFNTVFYTKTDLGAGRSAIGRNESAISLTE
jgi:hypothetical protein